MHRNIRIAILTLLLAVPGFAQSRPATPASAPAAPAPAAAPDEETVNRTRRELMSLLRESPRLTEVLSRDASLLGDAEYVQRTNPELATFLRQHPEIVRNPEFYLFGGRGGDRLNDIRFNSESERERVTNRIIGDVVPAVVVIIMFFIAVWILRLVMDNLRWKRIVRLQTDVHNKILDKFGNSQELIAYMQSDAGKRFLEGQPISVALGSDEPQWGSPIVRVMRPLQVGIVLAAAGFGFLLNPYEALQIFGKIMLAVGIGFIISAAASWLIARQSGLLEAGANHEATNRAL